MDSILDKLYYVSPALIDDEHALRLARLALNDLLRQVYTAPLFMPHYASLSHAISQHKIYLPYPEKLAMLWQKSLPEAYRELGWQNKKPENLVSRAAALKIISAGYRNLETKINFVNTQKLEPIVPQSGAAWLNNAENSYGKKAILALIHALTTNMPNYFSGLLIHGSVATQEVIPGYSDLDTLVILNDETVKNEEQLDLALRFLSTTHQYLLQYNPYMHHSHMLSVAMEMQAINCMQTPPILFSKGVYWGDLTCLPAKKITSDLECLLSIRPFEWFFEQWLAQKTELNDFYEILWWMSSVVFLPMLYSQLRDGFDRWKPEGIMAAKDDMLPDDWQLIVELTQLRQDLRDQVPLLSAEWWCDFPEDTHPCLATQHMRAMSKEINWRALGVTPDKLQRSNQLFRNLRQMSLLQWHKKTKFSSNFMPQTALGLSVPVTITEMPQPHTLQEYTDAMDEFILRAKIDPQIAAVYRFGEIACPGLSDIDFLVVMKKGASGAGNYAIETFTQKTQQIMAHGPMVIGEQSIEQFSRLFPLFSLEPLFENIRVRPQLTPLTKDAMLPLLISMLFSKYPADLCYLSTLPYWRYQTTLAFIHSFVHLKKLVEIMDVAVPASVMAVVNLDQEIRNKWLNKQFISWECSLLGMDLMFDATADLLMIANQLIKNSIFATDNDSVNFKEFVWRPVNGMPIKFTGEWTKEKFLQLTQNKIANKEQPEIIFPVYLGCYLQWLSQGNGYVSNVLKQQFFMENKILSFDKFKSYRDNLNQFALNERNANRFISKYITLIQE